MAKILVSMNLIADTIFGCGNAKVNIHCCQDIGNGILEFEISGEDVPTCDAVDARFKTVRNFRGDCFTTMEFVPVSKPGDAAK